MFTDGEINLSGGSAAASGREYARGYGRYRCGGERSRAPTVSDHWRYDDEGALMAERHMNGRAGHISSDVEIIAARTRCERCFLNIVPMSAECLALPWSKLEDIPAQKYEIKVAECIRRFIFPLNEPGFCEPPLPRCWHRQPSLHSSCSFRRPWN